MPSRHLPVVPNLDQLKHQAKDLLRALHNNDADAIADLREFHPDPIDPAAAKLADAQHVLARSYEAPSWSRLVQATQLVDAIWADDIDTVRDLVTRNPNLIHEEALIRRSSNWGPPLTYAANVGRDRIIRMLYDMGARDLRTALERAALQGRVETGKLIYQLMGSPTPPDGALSGAAYTLSAAGTQFLLEIGLKVYAADGKRLAPVDVAIETDSRKPAAKQKILELYAQHGFVYPDTAPMALHRGRIDLLEDLFRRDPSIVTRTYSHRDIYPAEMGCKEERDATVGTPLGGTTLLHMCIDYDEMEIALWLLEHGADVNAKSRVGANGFGGYTPLFNAVVSQPNFWMNYGGSSAGSTACANLLLERGANPNVRASLWKELHPGYDLPGRFEFRDVTALGWGRGFPKKEFVSEPVMQLIRDAGGVE